MSREFGSYSTGYFHTQMEIAANDCLAGRDELTKLWGKFLEEFSPIAYSISSSEECDSGPDDPILETIQRMAALYKKLDDIEQYVDVYKRVAAESVRKELEKKKEKK